MCEPQGLLTAKPKGEGGDLLVVQPERAQIKPKGVAVALLGAIGAVIVCGACIAVINRTGKAENRQPLPPLPETEQARA